MQDFEVELLMIGADHSQMVKVAPIISDYGSKDYVDLASLTAEFTMIKRSVVFFLTSLSFFFSAYTEAATLRGWTGGVWFNGAVNQYDINTQPGVGCGVAVGTSWLGFLTTEFEAVYLYNSVKRVTVDSANPRFHGNIENFAGFFNAGVRSPFEFPMKMCPISFYPYIGVGFGAAGTKLNLHGNNLTSHVEIKYHFACQGFGGVSIPIIPLIIAEITLEIEGRCMVIGDQLQAGLAIIGLSIRV